MRRVLAISALFLTPVVGLPAEPDKTALRAGVATRVITPSESMWMAGYANRKKPSEGKATELYAKALALEDAAGTRLVIVTLDLVGVPRSLRDAVEKGVREKYQLPPASLLLNVSHTHCGPVVRSGGAVSYELAAGESEKIDRYVAGLQDGLIALVGQALADLNPAKLGYSHARAGFAMNRRLPTPQGYQNRPNPDGPVDHDVPVLRVESPDGKLRALLFSYACHNTTLSFYQFCGDYAGYAQQYLEEAHPGAVALFMMGCGGDQNPYPRGQLEHAQIHGRTLATAVEAALLPHAKAVHGPLRTVLEEVTLDFIPPPGRDELLRRKESPDPGERRKATFLLEELEQTGRIRSTYPYLVQAVQFGEDLTMLGLAGEVVVDYSLRLKRELAGTPLWISGYCNDVFSYVPSRRVLSEGGYEATAAIRSTKLAGPFAPAVEEKIVGKVHEVVRRVRGGAAPR